ncbi:hypothetical protein [Notoacmeibacter ruber]|uniref:Uncharacterized protein n=1 Tax=Notoacmeibacter ruber TaxID=2670375 RepID=A0A3L7JE25_9HYPH|nr:hypothetical protein [Notoacmeibacter ruber]RLQ88936.1 hypothetical protein D8780_12550 [Notoacmeibacter ruber]
MSPSITIRTIADYHLHDHALTAYCRRCNRFADLDIPELAKKYGDWTPERLALRMVCKDETCRARDVGFLVSGHRKNRV